MPSSATSSTASISNSSNTTPKFSQTRFALEIRPIIGIRNADYEFIVNPIVDVGFGKYGEADFAPAAARGAKSRSGYCLSGLEYYADFGEIGGFAKLADQQHTLFAVTDFKLGIFDVDFGVGYGLTPASDRWVIKTIWGYAFPVPGSNSTASERARRRSGQSDVAFIRKTSSTLSESTHGYACHDWQQLRSYLHDRSFAIRDHREGVPLARAWRCCWCNIRSAG